MESLFNRHWIGSPKRLDVRRWIVALLLAPFGLMAQIQPVQISVNVLPPYSAYLQDYAGAGQQVRIFVRNTTQCPLRIRLQGTLTGDNGVVIATSPNYRPPLPLQLAPLENRLLSRADLEGLFDLGQIVVQGMDKNALYRGLPLPDGNYQLCVRAFSEGNTPGVGVGTCPNRPAGQPLSAEFPLGCSAPLVIKAVEPPILISPLCDSEVLPTVPQTVVFTWTPPVGVSPASVEYTLRVVELPDQNIDPNVFIDAVVLPKTGVEVRNLRTSTFLYGPNQPVLQLGKRYAWRVQAIDRSGKLNFLNNGKAPVCAFQYGSEKTTGITNIELAGVKSTTSASAPTVVANPSSLKPKSPPKKVANVVMLVFCDQMFMVDKVTNDDLDHYSGSGTLNLKSPASMFVKLNFNDLVVRPLKYSPGKYEDTGGFHYWEVVKGKVSGTFEKSTVDKKALKLKTDPRTGGTAELSYQAVRLEANQEVVFNEQKNAWDVQPGGLKKAEIQGGIAWNSPLLFKPTTPDTKTNANGELVVTVAGDWYPLQPYSNSPQSTSTATSSLQIPFGKTLSGTLTELPGYALTLNPTSYLSISNGVMTARLAGSLKVTDGKPGNADMTIPFQQSNGLTFSEQIEDPQISLGEVDGKSRLFVSAREVNVKLADLFEADDLPYPNWVKGLSFPRPDLWVGRMVYLQNADNPTSKDYLSWITVPLNPVVHRGKGYETVKPVRKDLNVQSPYLGYQCKLTESIAVIKNSEFKTGMLIGEVYIPFVGAVANLQIDIKKYGLGDASAWFGEPTERTLLQTPQGDRVTLRVEGGYFGDDGYFHPDLWVSAFNATSNTRGINAQDIHLDGIDVIITPKGELTSGYLNAKAEAVFGGSKQKTAYLNGLDYHLHRVLLGDEPGGKNARLSFVGKMVLGEKIVTDDQYAYDLVFAKPAQDVFQFNATPYIPVNKLPKLPPGSGLGTSPKGGGPYADPDEWLAETGATANPNYYLEQSAPATYLKPMAVKTVGASFNTGTAAYTGQFMLFTDDATYGNGFRLDVGMSVFQPTPMTVAATVIAGKALGVKYWFAGFKYVNPSAPGVPLFLNLEAYGFEGRIYSHMKHVGNPQDIYNDNYVPDAKTSFGLYTAMPIRTAVDNGRFLWGKTGLEITFQGFVPSKMMVRGDVNIEQLGGTGDATTSRIQGFATVELDVKNTMMLGYVSMTKCDLTAACATGDAFLYLGPKGFAASAGSPDGPIKITAFCGSLGKLTPSAEGYALVYATTDAIPGLDWIPQGIGLKLSMTATLLDLDTREVLDNPWASVVAKANAYTLMQLRPSILVQAKISANISIDAGYHEYTLNLASLVEDIQLSLPDPVCLAYNKRICYPVIGGINLVIGVKNLTPVLKTNGDKSDMCFDDGVIKGECAGLIGWLANGVDYVIDGAGKILKKGGELLDDACDVVCPWRW